MTAERHRHSDRKSNQESAREDAELVALESERYPPFTWGQFLIVFGLGIVLLSFFVWSLMLPGRAHGPPSLIQGVAAFVGMSFLLFAIVGRRLQNREDRKQKRANP